MRPRFEAEPPTAGWWGQKKTGSRAAGVRWQDLSTDLGSGYFVCSIFRNDRRGRRDPVEFPIYAGANDVKRRMRRMIKARAARHVAARQARGPAQIHVKILSLETQVAGEGVFEAGTGRPTRGRRADRPIAEGACARTRLVHILVRVGEPAGDIGQDIAEGQTQARPRRAEPIELAGYGPGNGHIGGSQHCRTLNRAPVKIRFAADDEIRPGNARFGELVVEADLTAADESAGRNARTGQRAAGAIGVEAEWVAPIAAVHADINAGPRHGRRRRRRIDRRPLDAG